MKVNKEQHEHAQAQQSETVLVLQGGGSLGAYECGVYKTIAKHGIKFDILAGSSIGAINSSIICSAENANKDGATVLEDFWLALSESGIEITAKTCQQKRKQKDHPQCTMIKEK